MNTRSRTLTNFGLMGMIAVFIFWGCAGVEQKFDSWQSAIREKLNFEKDETEEADQDSETEYFIHTTQWPWETMTYVAEWYTGDPKNEKNLTEINPGVASAKLAVGSKVRIPVKLLKTREPLPRNFSGEDRPKCYQHTVHWPGETLSLVASWYTGSSGNWRKVAAANTGLNPNRIKNGDVICIPTSLLKTRVPLPQKVAAKYTSDYFAYTVKKDNENLEEIARRFTGNPANRKLLAKANPDLDPARLKAGNEVYIPQNLLKIREPRPDTESARTDSKPAAKTPPAEPDVKPAAEEKIKLFGPKQFPDS